MASPPVIARWNRSGTQEGDCGMHRGVIWPALISGFGGVGIWPPNLFRD